MSQSHQFTTSTIIVSFNTADLTVQAIQSVLDNYTQDAIEGEIIVVDNNSTDESVTRIKEQFGQKINLISNTENVGFAKANNQAMKVTKGKYIFLLNSDTKLHSHAIKNLLKIFTQHPDQIETAVLQDTSEIIDRVGMVSGQLLNPDGSIQPQGGALPNLWNLSWWWLWPLPGSAPLPARQQYHIQNPHFFTTKQSMGWLGGTALMVRKQLINEVGKLDKDIFMYAEDVEWAIRAHNHHWDVVFTPEAQITHFGSASSNNDESLAREVEGLLYIGSKHWPIWKYEILVWLLRLGALLRWGLFGIILSNEKKQALYRRIFNSTFDKKV